MTTSQYNYMFKFVVLGDNAVGKTSLVKRYVSRGFETEYFPTLEANVTFANLTSDKFGIDMSVWDMVGDLASQQQRKKFYTNTAAAVIVFELLRQSSFDHVDAWYSELVTELQRATVPIYLVGNKTDLVVGQQVILAGISDDEIQQKVRQIHALKYFETSAKTGKNVDSLFNSIVVDLLKRRLDELEGQIEDLKSIRVSDNNKYNHVQQSMFLQPGIAKVRTAKDLSEVTDWLKTIGFDARRDSEVAGHSGTVHTFSLVIVDHRSGGAEVIQDPKMVVDIVTGDAPIGEEKVLAFFAKCYDVRPEKKLLVFSPGLADSARKLAKSYAVDVLESKSISRDLQLALMKSLVDLTGLEEEAMELRALVRSLLL